MSDDARGSWATTRALRAAGIPVLELHADNVDDRGTGPGHLDAAVGGWLQDEVLPRTDG